VKFLFSQSFTLRLYKECNWPCLYNACDWLITFTETFLIPLQQDVIGISADQLTPGPAFVAAIARPVLLLLLVQTLRYLRYLSVFLCDVDKW